MSSAEQEFKQRMDKLLRRLMVATVLLFVVVLVGGYYVFNTLGFWDTVRYMYRLKETDSMSASLLPTAGIPLSEADLAAVDLIVDESGAALPAGSGNPTQGRLVFEQRCQSCHGITGEGTIPNTRLVGGDMHSVDTPLRTVGSFWPHSTTLFDYVRRAMPADAPKSLSNDEVYQVTAYLLYLNGIIGEDTTVDASSLLAIEMPNADGFIDRSHVQ